LKTGLSNSINRRWGFNGLSITHVCKLNLNSSWFSTFQIHQEKQKEKKKKKHKKSSNSDSEGEEKKKQEKLKKVHYTLQWFCVRKNLKYILQQCQVYEACNAVLMLFCGTFFDGNFELKEI